MSVIARQVSGKNCLAAIFASRHQDASPGPLGKGKIRSDLPRHRTGENRPDESRPNHFVHIFVNTVENPVSNGKILVSTLVGDSVDDAAQRNVSFADAFVGIFVYTS